MLRIRFTNDRIARNASTIRILAHELGHTTGTLDNGTYNMNNVNAWENPIMFRMPSRPNDHYLRTRY